MKGFSTTAYDAVSGTATIGPGSRWSEVAKDLEPFGVAVAGGRIGHVGVGGYLTGGMYTFLEIKDFRSI